METISRSVQYTTEEQSRRSTLAWKGRERAVGHAGMTGRTQKLAFWGLSEHTRLKDDSHVPLIISEAERPAWLRGHTIGLAICPLEER